MARRDRLLGRGFELAAPAIVNPNWWTIGEVDYEMGITPVGFALGFWGAALAVRRAVAGERWLTLALLALVLSLPLLFNGARRRPCSRRSRC